MIRRGEIPSIYYSQLVLSYLKDNKHLSTQFTTLLYQLLPPNKTNQFNYIFNMIISCVNNNDNNNILYSHFVNEIKKIVPHIWKNKHFQKQIILKYNLNKKYNIFLLLKSLNITEKELLELIQYPRESDDISEDEKIEMNDYISSLKDNKTTSKKNEESSRRRSKKDGLLFNNAFEVDFDECIISQAIQNYEKKEN